MRKIYVAATQQHDGKTTVSMGLYNAAEERGHKPCFIKPVGQRYVEEDGVRADEDAVLFKRALHAGGQLRNMSPVTIPRGFTQNYVFNRDPEDIRRRIQKAFDDVATGADMAVIEGTGHAGVGSVIDASNAAVAGMLGADVVLISRGGVGRCIDEICLNYALFEKEGVRCIGAVINKVYEEKYDAISGAVRQGLKNNGIECLGVIPYCRELTYPTVAQIRDELDVELFCGEPYLDNQVQDILVGAMEPQNMIGYLKASSLIVVPGDRVDNIVLSVNAHLMSPVDGQQRVAGLLLTGGLRPDPAIMSMVAEVNVPVLLCKEDTATAAYNARRFVAKIMPSDTGKIALAERLIREHVDVDRVFGV